MRARRFRCELCSARVVDLVDLAGKAICDACLERVTMGVVDLFGADGRGRDAVAMVAEVYRRMSKGEQNERTA